MPKSEPPDAGTHYDLGFAYAEMGLYADARDELTLGLRLDPGHRDAIAARALVERMQASTEPPRTLH